MEEEKLLKIFGLNLKFERMKHGFTQETVAEALNVSAVYVSNVEAGKHRVSLVNAKKFADFYDKSIDYLIAEKA